MKNVVVLNPSSNQSISSKKSLRKNNRIISRSFDQNISPPANMIYHGLLQSPPPPRSSLCFSYPPPNSIRKQQQPPLLPLPFTKPINNTNRKHGIGSKVDPKMKPVTGQELKPISMLGPDPNELPRNVSVTGGMFSGSAIFTLSPPPSSLPLPNFFRRPKLRCNVEAGPAGGVNLGATDNLRRLLRLQ